MQDEERADAGTLPENLVVPDLKADEVIPAGKASDAAENADTARSAESRPYDLRKKKLAPNAASKSKQRTGSKGSLEKNLLDGPDRIVNIQDWYQQKAVAEAESTIDKLRSSNAEKKAESLTLHGVY